MNTDVQADHGVHLSQKQNIVTASWQKVKPCFVHLLVTFSFALKILTNSLCKENSNALLIQKDLDVMIYIFRFTRLP